ncbi:MAG: hypothetical protein ABIJ34_02205 [archaeon]
MDYLISSPFPISLVQHPKQFATIDEKAQYLDWSRDRIIKAIYCVHRDTSALYLFVVPELGRIDFKKLRDNYSENLGFNPKKKLAFAEADQLPPFMEDGTCNPFIPLDLNRVAAIMFDYQYVVKSYYQGGMDDFAIALNSRLNSHTLSLHMNYGDAHDLLKKHFPNIVRTMSLDYE